MKRVAFLLFMLMPALVLAQDKIVTTHGDTIHCKILEAKDDHIRFQLMDDTTAIRLIPKKLVSSMEKMVIFSGITYAPRPTINLRIGAGYAYLIRKQGNPTDNLKYNSGYTINTALNIYPHKTFGFGFRYSLFRSSWTSMYLDPSANPTILYDTITGSVSTSIHSIGTSFNVRIKASAISRWQFLLGLTPTYTVFRSRSRSSSAVYGTQRETKSKSDAFALAIFAGTEFKVYRSLYVSFLVNAEFTFFNHIITDYGYQVRKEYTNDLDMKRIETSLGLSYYF